MKIINSIFNVLRFNRRNWKAVVLCVFTATVFWFLNALNKTYTTNLKFPLAFEYDQQNFIPVKSLPADIRINVTGNGWDLFRRSAGFKIPALEIPVDRPVETKKIVGSKIPQYFSNQLEGLQVNYVLTDTLFLDLAPKDGRWIKLSLDTSELSIRKGYSLSSNVSIMPDSIFVEGPQPLIKAIKEPVNIAIPFTNIDEHFMEDVEVQLPSSDAIKRNPPTVVVMFDVDRMITITDSIRLVIENIPTTVWPVMGRKEIPIIVSIPQNMLTDFSIDSAKAVLDLENVERGEYMLKPEIHGLPPFSRIIDVDSVRVKF